MKLIEEILSDVNLKEAIKRVKSRIGNVPERGSLGGRALAGTHLKTISEWL